MSGRSTGDKTHAIVMLRLPRLWSCPLERKLARQRHVVWRNMRATQSHGGRDVDATESRNLRKGTRIYWRGDAADSGVITETSWDAVTITWDNGHVAAVLHGDMRDIQLGWLKSPHLEWK